MVLDSTQDINNAFHVGGSMMLIAGMLFMLLHFDYFQRNRVRDEFSELENALPAFSSATAVEVVESASSAFVAPEIVVDEITASDSGHLDDAPPCPNSSDKRHTLTGAIAIPTGLGNPSTPTAMRPHESLP